MIYRHYRHDSITTNTYILHTHHCHSILHHSTFAKLLLERKTKRCGSDSRYVKSQSMPSWLQRAPACSQSRISGIYGSLQFTPMYLLSWYSMTFYDIRLQAPSPAGAASWDLGVSEGAPSPPPDLRGARCAAPAWCGNRPGCRQKKVKPRMKSNEYTVLVGFEWFWAILNGIWMDFYEMFSTTKTCQVFISGSLHGVTCYWSPDHRNFSSLPFEPQWTAEGRRCWMVPVRPSDTSPVQQKSDQINTRRKRKAHFESLRYIQFNDS